MESEKKRATTRTSKRPTTRTEKRPRPGQNAEGLWSAVAKMVETPAFVTRVANSPKEALSAYGLSIEEERMLRSVAREGLDRVFEGNPGRHGRALATHMGKLRSKVSKEGRAVLNDTVFRRYIDPMRLYVMHESL